MRRVDTPFSRASPVATVEPGLARKEVKCTSWLMLSLSCKNCLPGRFYALWLSCVTSATLERVSVLSELGNLSSGSSGVGLLHLSLFGSLRGDWGRANILGRRQSFRARRKDCAGRTRLLAAGLLH